MAQSTSETERSLDEKATNLPREPRTLLLAAALFGLVELLTIPILILALMVVPLREGRPAIQADPAFFWAVLAVAIAIPIICSLYFYLRVKHGFARLRKRAH